MDGINCCVCFNPMVDHSRSVGHVDRRPVVVCESGHSVCNSCRFSLLRDPERCKCPLCRGVIFQQRIFNVALRQLIEEVIQDHPLDKEMKADGTVNMNPGFRGSEEYNHLLCAFPAAIDSWVGGKIGFYFFRCFHREPDHINCRDKGIVYLEEGGMTIWFPQALKELGILTARSLEKSFGSSLIDIEEESALRLLGRTFSGCMRFKAPHQIIQLLLVFGLERRDVELFIQEAMMAERFPEGCQLHRDLIAIIENTPWGTQVLSRYRVELVESIRNGGTLPQVPQLI